MPMKDYLGDGAYAAVTRYGDIRLYTSDGVTEANNIILGPYEAKALVRFIERAFRSEDPAKW